MDEPVATSSSTKAGKSSLFGADEPVSCARIYLYILLLVSFLWHFS